MESEPYCVGNLSELVTMNKGTYAEFYNYYKTNPVEWVEMITGVKLKWYQKIFAKSIFKNK